MNIGITAKGVSKVLCWYFQKIALASSFRVLLLFRSYVALKRVFSQYETCVVTTWRGYPQRKAVFWFTAPPALSEPQRHLHVMRRRTKNCPPPPVSRTAASVPK